MKFEFVQNIKNENIAATGVPMQQFLQMYLKDKLLTYTIVEKNIVISSIDKPFIIPAATSKRSGRSVKGKITDKKGIALYDVNIEVVGSNKGCHSDSAGVFELDDIDEDATLKITHVNYESQIVKASTILTKNIELNADGKELIAVTINNTGYQSIPRERATGSFVKINNELLNRRVSTNILDRLLGTASGLSFNSNLGNSSGASISIRGRSTIFSNPLPLVVLDNFPYMGDLNTINPNDIESISILRDAAGASIWGAYAGNGVVVITTKKGKLNQSIKIDFNANVTIGQKPDQYYSPKFIGASDMIDIETYLFNNNHYDNYYDAMINRKPYPGSLTPVIEILLKKKAGLISETAATDQINVLKGYDVRNDFDKYVYRKSVNQQYAINISGGGSANTYQFSAGFDRNMPVLTYNKDTRVTLNANNTFVLSRKLELQTGFNYIEIHSTNNNGGRDTISMGDRDLYPYAVLANENGDALPVSHGWPLSFIDTIPWAVDPYYRPLQEIRKADNTTRLYNTLINAKVLYKIMPGLRLEANVQYLRQNTNTQNLLNLQSYYTRNLINIFHNPSGNSEKEKYPVPVSGILDETDVLLESIRMRGQVNFDRTFHRKHAVSAIAGAEKGDVNIESNTNRLYGYNANTVTNSSSLNYVDRLPTFRNLVPGGLTIPFINRPKVTSDASESYFINSSYTYDEKYTISTSGRIDLAHIFGAHFNNKAVPLWSAGASWLISNEDFFHLIWISSLKLRATIGYMGNVNTNIPASQTFNAPQTPNNLGYLWSSINNPSNPYLGWERTRHINLGLDFEMVNNRISGHIEFYSKKCDNLIGISKLAPSAGYAGMGMLGYMTNSTNMKNHGVDFEINSKNIKGDFSWNTFFLFSYNKDKIIAYDQVFTSLSVAQASGGFNGIYTPVAGKPLSGIFSYKWAGLNPTNGDPRGFIGKELSSDYKALINVPVDSMTYNGPGQPVFFGSVTNTFSWKQFSLSLNVGYKLGYYFRANTINYFALYNTGNMHSDFSKRWQTPGDNTNVPSMIYPLKTTHRDDFFTNAEVNVYRGDHLRLQDIRLSYDFTEIK